MLNIKLQSILRASLAAGLATLASCAATGTTAGTMYLEPGGGIGQSSNGMPADTVSFWDGGSGNGPARIHLDLSAQIAHFYRGDIEVGRSRVSSGDVGHRTPTGKFSILEKDADHFSSRYGDYVYPDGSMARANVDVKKDAAPPGSKFKGAEMLNFMRLTYDGVGMHKGFLPGYPASHGCVRMPEQMAEIFYNNVAIGTPVLVTP